jgi:hypothetical protein
VAPTSKYNLVVDRASTLDVLIGEDGSAESTFRLEWRNEADRDGEPYAFLRSASTNQEGVYGAWVRVILPEGAELLEATGQATARVGGVERTETEVGRKVFGNYLMIGPGTADLTYRWRTAGVVMTDGEDRVYRLTIQKQPGMRSEPVTVQVSLPDGATLVAASEGAEVSGQRVGYRFDLTRDAVFEVRFRD